MKNKESEKTIERRLVRMVTARGGMALKYASPYHVGMPDRVLLLPGGKTVFVELKGTREKPTALQVLQMEKLTRMGFPCYVIDSTAGADELIAILFA